MKTYEVIIDYKCLHLTIEANSKEEAEQKAIEMAHDRHKDEPTPDHWVGDCNEVV